MVATEAAGEPFVLAVITATGYGYVREEAGPKAGFLTVIAGADTRI